MTPESNALNLAQSAFEAVCKERDEALAKLSTVYRWIERNHSDGFIDSQSYLQNLDRVADAWHDKLEDMQRELGKTRDQLEAMREAIKEARIEINYASSGFAGLALRVCPNDSAVDLVLSRMTAALAKLQPFLP
jgi:hypothetical protein